METGLFVLQYAASNLERRVYYESSPRRIGVRNVAIDPDFPFTSAGGPPDAWPYADGDLVATRYETAATVNIYATRTFPFARIDVVAAPPSASCDLLVTGLAASGTGFSFAVSTTHGPWSSSLTPDSVDFTASKTTYAVALGANYTVYVRDALGCQVVRHLYVPTTGEPSSPTNPPAGGILLQRLVLPSLADPDLFRIKEDWYSFATRTATRYFPADSADGSTFNRDTTEIIDRWCVDPGVAPYREVQVSHNGTGNVDFTNVDGVTTCMVTCTLGLTLTASDVANGRADIAAMATGGHGPVLVSLDDFDTPGLPTTAVTGGLSHLFTSLRPGGYTISARETRAGGCTARATLTITAPYLARYEVHFKDLDSTACLLRILQREYNSEPEELEAQYNVVALDWPGNATGHIFSNLVLGSECALSLYMMSDEQLIGLFSGDERLHKVEYYREDQLIWAGYLLPEQYDVAFLSPPATFNLSATDGLGTLSDVPFQGPAGQRLRGDWSVVDVVLHCLNKLDLGLPLHTLVNLFPSTASPATGALEQVKVDVSQYADDDGTAWSCGKVLTVLLTAFQARLYQQNGAWWLERLRELTLDTMSYVSYYPGGVIDIGLTRSLFQVVLPPDEGQPHWLDSSQRQSLRPAVASVTVTADPGAPANLLRHVLPKNSDLPGLMPAGWSGYSSTPATPYTQLVYQGKDKAPLLRLAGTTANATTPELAPYVQTPAVGPVPLRDLGATGVAYNGTFTLSFTAKPYGNTPTDVEADQSSMFAALHFGNVWVAPFLAFPGEDPVYTHDIVVQSHVPFPDSKEVKVSLRGYGATPRGPQPIYVRFVAPVGGATPCTVDISDIQLTWEHVELQTAETYTTTYTTSTGSLVSRVDKDTTLFHSDTPSVRRQGTLLDGSSLPVRGWFEPAAPGVLREIGDYLVRDRNIWQSQPAQVLSGTLRGQLYGPGTILSDPNETRPAAYLLTAASHDAASATWRVTAVQLSNQTPPVVTLPDYAIYHEDGTAFRREDGTIMTYEHA